MRVFTPYLINVYKNKNKSIDYKRKEKNKMEKVSNFTPDKFERLLNDNTGFYMKVLEAYQENVIDWLGEEIEIFKDSLSMWSIGFNQYNYLKIKDHRQFIYDCEKFKNWFGMNEENEKLVNDVIEWVENDKNEMMKHYDDILEQKAETLKEMMLNHFNDTTTTKDEYLVSHCDCMNDNQEFDGMYIKNDDYKVIYIDIPAYTQELK